MTKQEVKADLQDIRYYYTHREMFERAEDTGFKNAVTKKAERYAQAMANAPPRLHTLFFILYVEGKTQSAAAQDWGVSECYIRSIGRKLLAYLVETI